MLLGIVPVRKLLVTSSVVKDVKAEIDDGNVPDRCEDARESEASPRFVPPPQHELAMPAMQLMPKHVVPMKVQYS